MEIFILRLGDYLKKILKKICYLLVNLRAKLNLAPLQSRYKNLNINQIINNDNKYNNTMILSFFIYSWLVQGFKKNIYNNNEQMPYIWFDFHFIGLLSAETNIVVIVNE